jgi:glycogen(starch) synthase
VGRLAHQKGFDLALVAFGSIAERFPDVALVIAGDGPLRNELEALADTLRIKHRIEFLGWISPEEVPALMNSATLVVMPSREDPFPLVAIEAALMARPLVAARVGGLREAVVHGETGLLVPPEDPSALADAFARVLDHPKFARQLGEAARTWALTTYSWERFVDAYDDLYQRLPTRRSANVST